MSFAKRAIDVQITLNNEDSFSGGKSIYLQGLRVLANISTDSGMTLPHAQIAIEGMSNDDMGHISTYGVLYMAIKFTEIELFDVTDESNPQSIFKGLINYADIDYNASPNVAINISAYANFDMQISKDEATSFKGTNDVATMIESIVKAQGLGFHNSGVTAKMDNHVMQASSPMDKVNEICAATATTWTIIDGTMYIFPNGSSPDTTTITVDGNTDFMGYPSYSTMGIIVNTLYQPQAQIGRKVTVNNTSQHGIAGDHYIMSFSHDLSTETQGGPWFTSMHLGDGSYQAKNV